MGPAPRAIARSGAPRPSSTPSRSPGADQTRGGVGIEARAARAGRRFVF